MNVQNPQGVRVPGDFTWINGLLYGDRAIYTDNERSDFLQA